MYNFDVPQIITGIHIWNANQPDLADWAIKDMVIDVSMDGLTWTELGRFSLDSPKGDPFYEGETLSEIEAFTASKVLITSLSSYSSECAGLS